MRQKLVGLSLFAFALGILGAPAAGAQSLAEAAAKERERRKGKTAKVITETDLRSSGRGQYQQAGTEGASPAPGAEASPAAGAAPAADGGEQPTDEEQRAAKKKELEDKIRMQLQVIAKVKEMMAEAERELADTGNLTFGGRRDALMKVLEEDKKEIAQAEAAIEQAREEARRLGIALSV